ncbi:uncharacterized protein MONBRDRAFT_11161 [Monosiga brevicollis MX1]|uniref:Uncharacterized protein n=1 Tax=Monosiga brevicollis TaxID=81824 RepID=A9V8D8_MONBE|nr:uncharacterized protein MONBRDRAFT_11161 [Monosiga brevicollis MX1]EDQ86251.1 predicted protein [Monosiga brevicollis MX1]|eukprot:XP_001748921.1 hypothetical protein [Monosiga brevicollis MX1]
MALATETAKDVAALTEKMRRLEAEADELHREAQRLNKLQQFAASKTAYKQFRARDDDAIALALEIANLAAQTRGTGKDQEDALLAARGFCARPQPYASLPNVTEEEQASLRQRLLGAVLGAVVGDAAATGVQWVYDPDELAGYEARVQAQGGVGLEYLDPPANAHFEYEVGRNSPYGEQALLLLKALAGDEGLDTWSYAQRFADHFGGDWHVRTGGYRDASCKGFLRNYALGLRPPESGAKDKQINCCARLAPLLLAFAGHPDLDQIVEACTRVTQNHDEAVAWARLSARVLEGVVRGADVDQAVKEALLDAQRLDAELDDPASEELYLVAGHLYQVRTLSFSSEIPDAVERLGKNCHTPNSYQTPVHAVLSVLRRRADCLSPTTESLAPERAQALFAECMRGAMREGGCCASRCGVAGALLGAYLAGRCGSFEEFLPPSWRARTLAYAAARRWALQIDALRHTAPR